MELSGIQQVLPGCEVRAVTMEDVPAIVELVARLTTEVLGESDANEAEIRDDLTGPHFDIAADTFIALSPNGEVVAYGMGQDEHSGVGWMDVYIDPSLDDERFAEVADAAVAACRSRIIESAASRGESSIHLTANLYDVETRMQAAYERGGLEVETIYWRLELSLGAGESLETAVVPDGVRLVKVDPNDDSVMEIAYRLFCDTSSEHHGLDIGQKTLADFAEEKRTAESYDPAAWWFAYDEDREVGLVIGDDRRVETGVGYIGWIGTTKQARGRGIARALLLTSFADYRARGRTGVQLGVDSGNTTGATRLYESVGMTSLHSAIALGALVEC